MAAEDEAPFSPRRVSYMAPVKVPDPFEWQPVWNCGWDDVNKSAQSLFPAIQNICSLEDKGALNDAMGKLILNIAKHFVVLEGRLKQEMGDEDPRVAKYTADKKSVAVSIGCGSIGPDEKRFMKNWLVAHCINVRKCAKHNGFLKPELMELSTMA